MTPQVANSRKTALSAYQRRDFVSAAKLAADYLSDNPDDDEMLDLAGGAYFQIGAIDDAGRMYKRLAGRNDGARAQVGLARIAYASGDRAAAETALSAALDADPMSVDAWNLLKGVRKFTRSDPFAKRAKQILAANPADPRLRRELNFTLSKAMNDIEHWDRAWTYAEAGAAALTPRYDPGRLSAAVAAQKAVITPSLMASLTAGEAPDDAPAPIFIVGMPRSGTTLIEKILEAHPRARSGGEAAAMPHLANAASSAHARAVGRQTRPHEWMKDASAANFADIGARYLDALQSGENDPRRTIDKMPGNILLCATIRASLPKAKIIWVRRDPLDTCVSCFLARFGVGHDYSYRPDWLAQAWRDYEAAGMHYSGLLGDAMLEVRYEDLVTQPMREVRRLLDFVELSWNEDCLSPEKVEATSLTLSTAEVRRPISARSVGGWRRYRKRLAPLASALHVELPD